jgi:hypothetical protein
MGEHTLLGIRAPRLCSSAASAARSGMLEVCRIVVQANDDDDFASQPPQVLQSDLLDGHNNNSNWGSSKVLLDGKSTGWVYGPSKLAELGGYEPERKVYLYEPKGVWKFIEVGDKVVYIWAAQPEAGQHGPNICQ